MRFTIDDALRVGEILSQAAQNEIMPRFGRLLGGEVREKSSRFGIITNADEAEGLSSDGADRRLDPLAAKGRASIGRVGCILVRIPNKAAIRTSWPGIP